MLLKFTLLLLLISIISQLASSQEEWHFLYRDGECRTIQAFQTGRNYYYTYDGIVEHVDSTSQQTKFGFRVKCSRVLISVLASCAGRMKVDGCVMYDGEMQENGELTFDNISPKSAKFDHMLHRYPAYFYFNSGEITKLFTNENEDGDVTNMKKAILSALSLKFSGQGFKQPTDNTFKIPGTSIFGSGDAYATVSMKTESTLNITTRRYLFEHKLPWEQYEYSVLRLSGISDAEDSSLMSFIAHEMQAILFKQLGISSPTQTCQYHVRRSRRVADVLCHELHTVPYFSTLTRPYQDDNNYMSTKVTLHLGLYRISILKEQDAMTSRQKELLRNSYRDQTLAFQSTLDKVNAGPSSFVPKEAFLELMEGSVTQNAPVFSKLTMWIKDQDESTINDVWYTIMSSLASNPQALPKAMSIWIQLLNECMDQKWCRGSDCTHLLGCQNAFSSLLSSSGIENMHASIQQYLLDVLSSIKHPTSSILQTSLYFASSNTNPATVLALGKILNRFVVSEAFENSDDVIVETKEFLNELIQTKCPISSQDRTTENEVTYAIESLGPLIQNDDEILQSIISCIQLPSAPNGVLLAGVRATNNEKLISLVKVRRQLSHVLNNRGLGHEPRIASFLVIMMNNPNNQEISDVFRIANDPDEVAGIKYFMNEYIKSQLFLHGTDYSSFSNRTVEKILVAIDEAGNGNDAYTGGVETSKKTFEFQRVISLPFVEHLINGTMKASFYFAGKNPAPFMMDLSLETEINNINISIVDIKIDVGKVVTVLVPLLGKNGFLPLSKLEHLMSIPLNKWMEIGHLPFLQVGNLNKLTDIADQFRLAQTVIDVQKKSLLTIKLFGKEFSADVLSKLSFVKDLSFVKLLELGSRLETGITFNETLLGMPAYFKSQVPTSLGLPLVTNVEFTNLFQPAFFVMLEVKKLYFTNRGTCIFHADHTFQLHTTIEHVMQLPRGTPCGSGVLFTVEHDIDLRVEATYSPTSLISKTTSNPKSQLLVLSSKSLAASWTSPTGFEITSSPRNCRKSIINEYYDISMYTTSCGGPIAPRENGLWFQTNGASLVKQYFWGPMQALQDGWDGVKVPAVGFKIKGYRPLIGEEEYGPVVFDLGLYYLPLQKEIQFIFHKMERRFLMIRSNLLITRDESVIDMIFSSLNVSTESPAFTSTILMEKATDGSSLESKLSSLNLENDFQFGAGLGYDVRGTFSVSRVGQFEIFGHIPAPTVNGEFTALGKIYSAEASTQPICTIVYEKSRVHLDNRVANNVEVSAKDFVFAPYFPWTNISLSMLWLNDSTTGYMKVLRLESWLHGGVSDAFVDLRQATVFSSNGDQSDYDWNATVTMKNFQGQWRADARDHETFTVNSHVVIPEEDISVATVKPLAYHLVQIPIDSPNARTYGIDVILGTSPKSHVNTTVFYLADGFKNYVHLMRNRGNCDHCFAFEIHTLPLEGIFKFKILPNILQNSASLKVHPTLAQSLCMSTATFSTFDNGKLKAGYDIDVKILSSNVTLVGGSRTGSYICKVLGGLGWQPEDLSHQDYSANIALNCEKEVATLRSISDLNLGAIFNYKSDTSETNKNKMVEFSHYIQKSELLEYNETYSVNIEIDEDLLRLFSLLRSTVYNLAESETNDAVMDKKGIYNVSITYQEGLDNLWSNPSYYLNTVGVIPARLLTPGGNSWRYAHSGSYFLGHQASTEDALDEVCQSMESCKQRYRNVLQDNIDRSLRSMMSLFDYTTNEYQQFVNVPWKQFHQMLSSPSYVEISPFNMNMFWMKEVGLAMMSQLKRLLVDYNDGIQTLQLNNFVTEDDLLKMQRSLEALAIVEDEEEYNLTPTKIYIESLFRMIYQLDFALGSILENPLILPKYLSSLNQIRTFLASPLYWLDVATEPYRTFGVKYPDVTQLITINKHYHKIPFLNSEECKWLGLVDPKTEDNIVVLTSSSLHAERSLFRKTLMQTTTGSFFMVDDSANAIPFEFPFFHRLLTCTKLTNEEVECISPVTNDYFHYDEARNELITYSEIRGSLAASIEGMYGIPGNQSVVAKFMLPDGSVALNEAKFLNKHELSGNTACQYSPEDFPTLPSNLRSSELCKAAFAPFIANPYLFDRYEVESLVKACSDKAEVEEDTCKYTSLLVRSLRQQGVPMFTNPLCLKCGATEPIRVIIDQVNILLMVSLSEDMLLSSFDPKVNLLEFARNTLQTLQENGIPGPTVTLLTYGGEMELHHPSINTMNSMISSSNLADIERAIFNLEFTGPSYDSLSTAKALDFVAKKLRNSYKGIIKFLIVMAPESTNQNMGNEMQTDFIKELNDDLTSVFLLSRLSDEECLALHITVTRQTTGGCYLRNNFSPLVEFLYQHAQEKVNRNVSCSCKEVDSQTGRVESRCSLD